MTLSANAQGASVTTLASLASMESRAWTRKLLLAGLLGVCVGALIGHAIFRTLGTDATATAFIRIDQPVDLAAVAGGASQTTPNTQENLQSYASGEVAYLSGTGFAQAVSQKLGRTMPADLDVMQDGQTTVVSISSTAPVESDAIRTVAMAVDLYRDQLRQRADEQLRAVTPILDRWEAEATPDRVQDIQGLRNRVELQATEASNAAVLQTATVNTETSHRGTVGALLGALLGGSALPVILMGRRRRAGLVSSDPEVAEAVDGILIADVDLRQHGRRAKDDPVLARTLWVQLPSSSATSASDRVVLVVGASSASGTDRVSHLLELAAAENGPVTTVSLTGNDDASRDLTGRTGTVIIDAGAIGDSPLAARAFEMATVVVLVARLGVDTVTQVLAVRGATTSLDVPFVAVFTHRPWWSFRKAGKAQKARPPEPEPELAHADG